MTGRRPEPAVASKQRSTELLRESDVGRIIGGKIVTELPHARQENEVRIADDSKVGQIFKSQGCPPI